jgi:hypothetical protein
MLTTPQPAIAVALVEGSTWNWELKVDDCGLFRWYLDGTVETNLRGLTPAHAELSLHRFVDESLRGELKIAHSAERFGTISESGHPAVKSAGTS